MLKRSETYVQRKDKRTYPKEHFLRINLKLNHLQNMTTLFLQTLKHDLNYVPKSLTVVLQQGICFSLHATFAK